MRIAIAGTGGLASWIAYYIQQETPHQVLLLSRSNQPAYESRGITVQVVDYNNAESLKFALSGIDIIVSTILGPSQLRLIEAAVRARVRRFIPAEFEGPPNLRPANDPLDRGRRAARERLYQYRNHIQYTIITCGIFYERFQPGGLSAARIGASSGFSGEGDYILNIRHMTAQVPVYDRNSQYTSICMTSARDVARYVVRALDLPQWPPELSVYGERMTVYDLVTLVSNLRGELLDKGTLIEPRVTRYAGGRLFDPVTWYVSEDMLRSELNQAVAANDIYRQRRVQTLIATAQGQYAFNNPNLMATFADIRPERFRDWVTRVWHLTEGGG
ncbi:MAG: hypothetical protein M1821_007118 [Bathelium mastoideum]|nr:MAG: hypothetical protein M1821_007118 [Bathelium mastoideum]KAI9694629.1 MAG: hypothetical protein M1822_000245 [Bathelium mastoideum]